MKTQEILIIIVIIVIAAIVAYHFMNKSMSPSSCVIAYLEQTRVSYALLHSNFQHSMLTHNIEESVWQSDVLNQSIKSIIDTSMRLEGALKSNNGQQISAYVANLVSTLNGLSNDEKSMNKSIAQAFFHDDQQQNAIGISLLIDGAKNIANQITSLI
jgi:hypothetical protein